MAYEAVDGSSGEERRKAAEQQRRQWLLTRLGMAVVASAWSHQLRLDAADDADLDQLVRAFRLGPQTLERGTPCSGGTPETA